MEKYLLDTGKFRLFFGWFLRLKYHEDVTKLMTFFNNWECVREGHNIYDVYRLFLKSYSWDFDRFANIVRVCLYTHLIKCVDHNKFKVEEKVLNHLNLKNAN